MYKQNPEADRSEVRRTLMDLLARRECSQAELNVKLRRRFGDHPDIEVLLNEAADRGWQDDQRFACVLLRSRIQRGQGPIRIRQELRQKGIDSDVVTALLAEDETDWFELAREARRRKFGEMLPADSKARARQMRFLAYRGFDGEMVRYALQALETD